VADFRYALVTPDHKPTDPAFLNTAVPDWREGDEFLTGNDLRKFRILAILPLLGDDELSGAAAAVWALRTGRHARHDRKLGGAAWREDPAHLALGVPGCGVVEGSGPRVRARAALFVCGLERRCREPVDLDGRPV